MVAESSSTAKRTGILLHPVTRVHLRDNILSTYYMALCEVPEQAKLTFGGKKIRRQIAFGEGVWGQNWIGRGLMVGFHRCMHLLKLIESYT